VDTTRYLRPYRGVVNVSRRASIAWANAPVTDLVGTRQRETKALADLQVQKAAVDGETWLR
jgi:hypothetical protein